MFVCLCVCVCVSAAVLVAVTVWNQKGSRSKFRKRGVYHIPAEHASWEDIRENILNYNEEGGGEQDQVHTGTHAHTHTHTHTCSHTHGHTHTGTRTSTQSHSAIHCL